MYTKLEGDNVSGFLINIISLIASPVISTILLLTFFLGITYQLLNYRVNVFGILSIVSLIIYYIAHILNDESSVFSLTLLILALGLFVVEFFIVGLVLGVIGILLLFLSIIFITEDPAFYSLVLLFILILVLIEVGVFVKLKKKKVPFWKRFVLTDATDSESGYTSFDDRSHLVGKVGVTTTPLRPSGTVIIDDERIDAVAEGSFIPGQVEVKVILVEGTRIVVRPIKSDEVNH